MADWQDWHRHYDADTSLSRRLGVVQDFLRKILAAPTPPTSVLTLCAGDGRDLIPVLADQPAERRPRVTMVELDPALAARAAERAEQANVELEVRVGDAGSPATWRDVPPVDLLMLCGIFGNVSLADVHTTIQTVPALLNEGGQVIWTRGYFDDEPDVRPQLREWFTEAGLVEAGFASEPTGYGVGVNVWRDRTQLADLPDPLFTFLP